MKVFFSTLLVFITITYSFAQNVGIGTNKPVSLLHVNDGTVLFSGLNYLIGNPPKPPVSGKGTRTFWYLDKAAFRTGGVYNSQIFGFPDQDTSNFHNWDRDSIGVFSFASGFNTKAKGDFSTAMGEASYSIGAISTAMGLGNKALGDFSFAAGNKNIASGENSVALGYYSTAAGYASISAGEFAISTGTTAISMGSNTQALGKHAVALGGSTKASGDYSTSMGDHSIASGDFSTAMGEYTIASGDYSTAFGTSSKASGYGSIAAGSGVIASGSSSTAMGVNANTNNHTNAFCIAGATNNLAANNTSDNQMMMRFDNYTFWVSSANYAYLIPASNGWAYTSDKNKKENFLELNGQTVLSKIATIPFYSWNFKANDTRQYRHYGIMAQDFYNAFGKDDLGIIGNDTTVSPLDLLGVAYSAIKELEKRTADLQKQNAQLSNEIESFKMMKDEMEKLKVAMEAIKIKVK